jgi:hypothetical protein
MTSCKNQLAVDYIKSCCPNVGSFNGSGSVNAYIFDTTKEMAVANPSIAFPDRYTEHVAYAMDMVANNIFTNPPAAVASVYLVTRFEYYFRILSGRMNSDGTWISSADRSAVQRQINDSRLNRNRISSVSLAYKIMKLNSSHPLSQFCSALDVAIYPQPITVTGGRTVADIGDRIEFGRHAIAHGHWGDISAESLFYGLMTALIFYSQA